MTRQLRFREVQRTRRPRWVAAVVGVTLCLLLLAVEAGSAVLTGAALAGGGAVLATVVALRLTVEVYDDGLFVHYRPIHRAQFVPHDRIQSVEHRTYTPAAGLGHWGIHLGFARPVYNVTGDDSVLVRYLGSEGEPRELLVGSTRARGLADELERARYGRPRRTRRFEGTVSARAPEWEDPDLTGSTESAGSTEFTGWEPTAPAGHSSTRRGERASRPRSERTEESRSKLVERTAEGLVIRRLLGVTDGSAREEAASENRSRTERGPDDHGSGRTRRGRGGNDGVSRPTSAE